MGGNFKVRCVDTVSNRYFTNGKIYEVKDGVLTWNDGDTSEELNSLEDIQRCLGSKFELVNENSSETIHIFTRKNRVVATITKGDQKFTQSVSLKKMNYDFKAAVKKVIDLLMDKFEVREIGAVPVGNGNFKSGDKVKIIDATNGAHGADGATGVIIVTPKDGTSHSGLSDSDKGIWVRLDNGQLWKIGINSKLELIGISSFRIVKQDKYEVGDKVKVRKDLRAGMKIKYGIVAEMEKLAGQIVTIERIWERDGYRIKEESYSWHPDCFEGKVIEDTVKEEAHLTAEDFKVGDRVKALVEVGRSHTKDAEGEVIGFSNVKFSEKVRIEVRFDKNILGGTFNCPADSHVWNVEPQNLEKIAVNDTPSFDWTSFKSGKFAVHCDTEEKAREFLKEAGEHDVRWNSGEITSKRFIWIYREQTCYKTWPEKGQGLLQSRANDADLPKIIDYAPSKPTVKEVKRPANVGEWIKIVNSDVRDKRTNNGEIYEVVLSSPGRGVRVKHPSYGKIGLWEYEYVVLDNYTPDTTPIDSNPEPEQPISSSGMREVKRPAKSGEYVKVVNAFNIPETDGKDEYANGDVLKIIRVTGSQARYAEGMADDGKDHVLLHSEYVVLENFDYSVFPKNEPFKKAKIGDKIKVVKDATYHVPKITIGDVQTVDWIGNDVVGTSAGNAYYDTNQEYIIIEEAQAAPAPEAAPVINIGDTVKVTDNGKTCSLYDGFINKYAPSFFGKFLKGYSPMNGDTGVVVGKGLHDFGGTYYVVLANSKAFCISGKGIQKVRN